MISKGGHYGFWILDFDFDFIHTTYDHNDTTTTKRIFQFLAKITLIWILALQQFIVSLSDTFS